MNEIEIEMKQYTMKAILSEAGFAFSATAYAEKYGNEMLLKFLKRYTVRTVDRTTKIPQITKLFKMVKSNNTNIIELPRFVMDDLVSQMPSSKTPITSVDILLPKPPQLDVLHYTGCSNPNQQVVVSHVVNNVFKGAKVAGVTLKLLAGQGKTFCAMDIISQMRMKTLVVVPNTYLLDQWVGLINQYYPHAKVGTLYGNRKTDGDIIVGIINTMAELQSFEVKEKKPWPNVGKSLKYMNVVKTIQVDDILQNVGLTIFDESQLFVSKSFRTVFRRIHSRYTIGLSATPDIRDDKLDIIHQSWLGPILDAETLEGFNGSQDTFISDVHMIDYHALNEHCQFRVREDGMIDYSSIIESIINDPHRNSLVIDKIVHLMEKGLYTFVFSDRRSHLEYLYKLLESKCKKLGTSASIELPEAEKKIILYGGASEDTIDKAKTRSTVIFTTYAYSSTGVSVVRMNALVLSTPRRSNMKQIVNRVFRLGSDQSVKRVIIDICDAKLPIKGQQRERVKAYQERGSTIIKSKFIASGL